MSMAAGLTVVGLLMAASGVLVATETSLLHIRRARAEVLTDPDGGRHGTDDRTADFLGLLAAGLAGLAIILVGRWLIARGLSRPLPALDAALKRDRDAVYHAAYMDPHTAAELPLDRIRQLCDELIEARITCLPGILLLWIGVYDYVQSTP